MRRALRLLRFLSLALLAGAALAAPPPLPQASRAPRIVVAFANPAHSAPAPAGTTGAHYGGDGYRVAQAAQRQARRVAETYALRELTSWPIEALSMHCVVYEITDGRPMAEVLAALARDGGILLAQPLQEFHTLTDAGAAAPVQYNDPLYDLQTNLTALGIARAHERTQGAGLKVALIDTAVDTEHPDLRGRIVRTHSYLSQPAAPASSRHGTAMAGLIAAVANNRVGIVGVAPLAQVEVFEACWQLAPDGDAAACNTFTLAQALAGALASGAPLVNLSIAGPKDPLLAALIEQGLRRGITFVGASAGAEAGFPTAVAGVLAAGGSEHPLPPGVLGAPSEQVLTLRPRGEYDFASGSSVAAAELTGVIALLMSASPTRLAPDAVAMLLRDSRRASFAAEPAPVDVNAALTRLDATRRHGAIAARLAH